MMLTNGIVKALSFFLLVGMVSACSPAPLHTESYRGDGGGVTLIENDREACVRACNAAFDRCGDARASQDVSGRGAQTTGVLGGGAECKSELKSCLAACKTR